MNYTCLCGSKDFFNLKDGTLESGVLENEEINTYHIQCWNCGKYYKVTRKWVVSEEKIEEEDWE